MLTFEFSDNVKHAKRRTACWNMATGAGTLILVVCFFLIYEIDNPRSPYAICLFLLGGPRLVVGMRSYYRDCIRRGIHRRVIANSRTLAIKVGGRPAVYIKRANCIAPGPSGFYLLSHDGTSMPLATYFSDEVDSFRDQFLKPLIWKWWPHLDENILEPACYRIDPYLDEYPHVLPLRFEATPFEKRDSVVSIARPFLLGLVIVVLGTVGLFIPMSELLSYLLILPLLAGALVLVGSLHELRRQWCWGEIHTCFVLNSRTLALVRPGKATLYFKRKDCCRAHEGGTILEFGDGRRAQLHIRGIDRIRVRNKFLLPLYRLWWPETPFSRVELHHGSTPPIWLLVTWLLLSAYMVPFGVALAHIYGSWTVVAGGALAFLTYGALLLFVNRWVRRDPSAAFTLNQRKSR